MGLSLSVAIVCRNNESTIGRTLASVRGLADEIVAVDSGSTDGTIGLLESEGARIIRSPWLGHVRTKQMALEACAGRWALCLDSDESLDEALGASVRGAIERDDPAAAGYRMNRKTWYRGRFLEHAWQPEWRLRLVRRGSARWEGIDPHDRLEMVDGGRRANVHDMAGTLRHDSFITFEEHLRKQWDHAGTMARSLHAAGRRGRVRDLLISPAGAFLKQLVLKGGWRDGYAGWLAAGSAAAGALMKHMVLIELGEESEAGSEPGGEGPNGSRQP